MTAKRRMKYEGETDREMSGHACKILVLALVTAALFIGLSFNLFFG